MANTYKDLKDKHQNEFNAFPMFFAFSDMQFDEGMEKLGLDREDTEQIYSMGMGGYYRKSDAEAFKEMLERHAQEMSDAVEADETGEGFILDMFKYELANHEYGYTYDVEDTLRALDFTIEEVEAKPNLKHGLKEARKFTLEQMLEE